MDKTADAYEELTQQHRQYEDRLEQLVSKSWLTPEEEMEEKRIKKLKLRVNDQLEGLRSPAS